MIFVDTGAFCAFSDRRDSFHVVAVKQFSSILSERSRLITSNFIVDETYTWIRYRLGYQYARDFLTKVRRSELHQKAPLEVITVDRTLEDKASRLLEKYQDQDLSYTDATSLALIMDKRIKRAFSFDQHFYLLPIELVPSMPS